MNSTFMISQSNQVVPKRQTVRNNVSDYIDNSNVYSPSNTNKKLYDAFKG